MKSDDYLHRIKPARGVFKRLSDRRERRVAARREEIYSLFAPLAQRTAQMLDEGIYCDSCGGSFDLTS